MITSASCPCVDMQHLPVESALFKKPVVWLVSQAFFPLEPNGKHMEHWSHAYGGSSL